MSQNATGYGYWGTPTSTMNYCEQDYRVSHYVAEFWNTLSNVSFLIFGFYGLHLTRKYKLHDRFAVQFWGAIVIGFGSALFHGMLTKAAQFTDQLPMVFSIMTWFYINFAPDWEKSPVMKKFAPIAITLYTAVYTVLHLWWPHPKVFQYHFGVWTAICLTRLHYRCSSHENAVVRKLYFTYSVLLWVGFGFWQIDLRLCKYLNAWGLARVFQGHAIWHLLIGASCLMGPATHMVVQAVELGLKPQVKYIFGLPILGFDKERSVLSN